MKKVTRPDAAAAASPAPVPVSRARKSMRLQLRLTEQQKSILSRAALLENTNLSAFIVQTSCEAAERALSAQRRFLVDEATWRAFVEALDEPARDLPALRNLMSRETVLDV